MFNGSSYHALPALLSDFHEALASVANGTDPRAGEALRSPALTPPAHTLGGTALVVPCHAVFAR